jgi:hypothetical protein
MNNKNNKHGGPRKGAGRPKEKEKRVRTTVSLWPEVWKLAEKIGGTRGRGLEAMAKFWKEKKQKEKL